jgi:aryl-alcohol dehydrogenase-like predicted oxidoreductase
MLDWPKALISGACEGVLVSPSVEPIGSGGSYRTDAERARRLEPLVREGHAESLIEAALRFVIANDAVSTVLVGYSTLEHLEYAARSINKGPLSQEAMRRLKGLQNTFLGEAALTRCSWGSRADQMSEFAAPLK